MELGMSNHRVTWLRTEDQQWRDLTHCTPQHSSPGLPSSWMLLVESFPLVSRIVLPQYLTLTPLLQLMMMVEQLHLMMMQEEGESEWLVWKLVSEVDQAAAPRQVCLGNRAQT